MLFPVSPLLVVCHPQEFLQSWAHRVATWFPWREEPCRDEEARIQRKIQPPLERHRKMDSLVDVQWEELGSNQWWAPSSTSRVWVWWQNLRIYFSLTRPFTSSTMNRSNSFVESSYKIRGQESFGVFGMEIFPIWWIQCSNVHGSNQPTNQQPTNRHNQDGSAVSALKISHSLLTIILQHHCVKTISSILPTFSISKSSHKITQQTEKSWDSRARIGN